MAIAEEPVPLEVASRFAGPPGMGHGGYVAGLLARHLGGTVQVTLRRPTPLDQPLALVRPAERRLELRDGDEVVAEAEPGTLDLEVPPPPSLAQAAAAEADSPARSGDRGVHPTCFGCGAHRPEGDGLRIFAGPLVVGGRPQVAGRWRPGPGMAGPGGAVDPQWVLAALDCPGAFAFLVGDRRAGLLGRIVFQQLGDVRADVDHVVTGWQVGEEGRKLFAGTAVFGPDSTLLAAARATWFEMPGGG
jgi:hypothetical protein